MSIDRCSRFIKEQNMTLFQERSAQTKQLPLPNTPILTIINNCLSKPHQPVMFDATGASIYRRLQRTNCKSVFTKKNPTKNKFKTSHYSLGLCAKQKKVSKFEGFYCTISEKNERFPYLLSLQLKGVFFKNLVQEN